ncbi:ribonuclease HII [Roseitranquillus sediminis]|uniref:ribonuclease HII n=1 Tax=Roseitranquillus sediminis TaxID=2809051 RepID=UPI001D0C8A7F|nr:ribonuclease HII [Roseitranquillus sediminis]MBM9593459.1 ribonuclease HII [Roseitranquillus sediminis]
MATLPDLSHELRLIAAGTTPVAGVDEVGRGPLAGPVTAAAVVLDPDCIPDGLNDSKRLAPTRRRELARALAHCAEISVAHADVEEIESLNIYYAAHLAMCRAVSGLPRRARHVLIDGNRVPQRIGCPADAVVGGDALCLSIAAASIVAKVARDAIMAELALDCPGFGWEHNAGYPTPEHVAALERLGPTRHHRRTFRPVHNILYAKAAVSA